MHRMGFKPVFSALLVAVALAFGVDSALARPVAQTCPYNTGTGQIGVSCVVRADCTAPCKAIYPGSPGGLCRNGCCECAY